MNIYILILGIIIGFLVAKICCGKKAGDPGLFRLRFNLKKYIVHLHHWLLASIGLIILILLNFYNNIIYGILIGLIIQGLTYKDFYKIIYSEQS